MKFVVLRHMTPCSMKEVYWTLQKHPTSISWAREKERESTFFQHRQYVPYWQRQISRDGILHYFLFIFLIFFACLIHFLTLAVSFSCNFLLVCFCLSVCLSLSLSLSVASFITISALHHFLFNFLFLIHPPILPTSVRFEVLMTVKYPLGWRQEILFKRWHISTKITWRKTNKSVIFPFFAYCCLFSSLFCLLGFY